MTATLRLHGGGSVSEEGKGVECGQLEMAGVGVGAASESTACARVVGGTVLTGGGSTG